MTPESQDATTMPGDVHEYSSDVVQTCSVIGCSQAEHTADCFIQWSIAQRVFT